MSENLGFGISLSAADNNTLSHNQIFGNSNDGIIISGANNILFENSVTANSGHGLSLIGGSGNQITNNSFSTNALGGIFVLNSMENLTGNTVSGNMGTGIFLSGANDGIVSDNQIFGNSSHGLLINGSGNDISDNAIYTNGTSGNGSGVFVESGSSNSILYNSIYDNSDPGIQLAPTANNSQVFPVLSIVYSWQDETALPEVKGGTYIESVLDAPAGVDYKVQFFASFSSDNRQGKRYLAEVNVTTNIAGEAEIIGNFKDVVIESGEVVSATATKLDTEYNPLSTSEFSAVISLNNMEGDHYKVNTTLAGIPLHWKDGKGDYQIAQSVVDLGYDDEVENGFNTWSGLQQLNYTRKNFANTEQWGGNADGVNNIVWISDSTDWIDLADAPTNVAAITRVRYNALNGETHRSGYLRMDQRWID